MVHSGRQHRVQRRPQVVVGLPRRAVDQVEVDVFEPAARASRAAATARPGVCRRSSRRSTCGAADCIPSETRVKPASTRPVEERRRRRLRVGSRSSPRRPAASPNVDRTASSTVASRSAPSSDGVPPPTNTVSTGRGPTTRRGQLQLAAHRVQPRRPGTAPEPASSDGRVGVEVAVAAARRAERHVDVDPEGDPVVEGGTTSSVPAPPRAACLARRPKCASTPSRTRASPNSKARVVAAGSRRGGGQQCEHQRQLGRPGPSVRSRPGRGRDRRRAPRRRGRSRSPVAGPSRSRTARGRRRRAHAGRSRPTRIPAGPSVARR